MSRPKYERIKMTDYSKMRIPYSECKKMTLKEIRSSKQYKLLNPLGYINTSGTYKYGNKSSMRKDELCKALDNPKRYQKKALASKKKKKNMSKRKRSTRASKSLYPVSRKPIRGECKSDEFPHLRLMKNGKTPCCYKRKKAVKKSSKK